MHVSGSSVDSDVYRKTRGFVPPSPSPDHVRAEGQKFDALILAETSLDSEKKGTCLDKNKNK